MANCVLLDGVGMAIDSGSIALNDVDLLEALTESIAARGTIQTQKEIRIGRRAC